MIYNLKPAVDTEETGPVYPHIDEYIVSEGEIDSVKLLQSLSPETHPPSDARLPIFIIRDSNIKFCDFLTSFRLSQNGLVISKKARTILELFNLNSVEYYPIKINFNGRIIEDYYYMHIYSLKSNCILFEKSSFYLATLTKRMIQNIGVLKSYTELKDQMEFAKKNLKLIRSDKLILDKTCIGESDFFRIGDVDWDICISERLATALVNYKITGLDITPKENVLIE